MTQLEQVRRPSRRPAWRDIESRIRRSITEWRSLLMGDVAQARQAFREGLTTPFLFTPFIERGYRAIRFERRIGLASLFGGAVVVTEMASLTGFEPVFWP